MTTTYTQHAAVVAQLFEDDPVRNVGGVVQAAQSAVLPPQRSDDFKHAASFAEQGPAGTNSLEGGVVSTPLPPRETPPNA